jgi:hypothetical protein
MAKERFILEGGLKGTTFNVSVHEEGIVLMEKHNNFQAIFITFEQLEKLNKVGQKEPLKK